MWCHSFTAYTIAPMLIITTAGVRADSPTPPSNGPAIRCYAVPDPNAEIPLLQQPLGELHSDCMSLEEAVATLAEATQTPIHPNWHILEAYGIERRSLVRFPPCARTLGGALCALFEQPRAGESPIVCLVRDGAIHVMLQETADLEMAVRIYDVRPLLTAFESSQRAAEERHMRHLATLATLNPALHYVVNVTKTLEDKSGHCCHRAPDPGAEPAHTTAEDRLADLIEQSVEPDCWLCNGGESGVRFCAGRMVVRTSPRIHAQLSAFLETLAESLTAEPGEAGSD